jgi:hypothetical protein
LKVKDASRTSKHVANPVRPTQNVGLFRASALM